MRSKSNGSHSFLRVTLTDDSAPMSCEVRCDSRSPRWNPCKLIVAARYVYKAVSISPWRVSVRLSALHLMLHSDLAFDTVLRPPPSNIGSHDKTCDIHVLLLHFPFIGLDPPSYESPLYECANDSWYHPQCYYDCLLRCMEIDIISLCSVCVYFIVDEL